MAAVQAIVREPLSPRTQAEPATDPDAQVVARAVAGDRAAFEALVRKYQRSIYFLALRHVRDPDDAKELVQRAFIKTFQALPQFRGASQFRTWLYRIAINLSLNHMRDHAKFVRDVALEEPDPHPAVDDDLVAATDARRLRELVARLPRKQRLAVELHAFEELPFREVGEILGTSEGAAKVNYHYGVKRLREWLGATEEAG
jgi:RNA polymerase sigma-70 factor (ECF subfamily)